MFLHQHLKHQIIFGPLKLVTLRVSKARVRTLGFCSYFYHWAQYLRTPAEIQLRSRRWTRQRKSVKSLHRVKWIRYSKMFLLNSVKVIHKPVKWWFTRKKVWPMVSYLSGYSRAWSIWFVVVRLSRKFLQIIKINIINKNCNTCEMPVCTISKYTDDNLNRAQ